ncbi:Hpt domain-containing protein [Sphingomonas quercus]|uniref:Hpt domain-containing protein n=1 Tax=Sphingomonas quercus TaxID=2842451 RepID=UPI00341FD7BB
MTDTAALDEIQAIFFEECAEGLSVAERGLSAMAGGDANPEVVGGVFRAVHSIKGGAGAFGHAPLSGFAHRFEAVLDEIRSGRVEPDAAVTGILRQAFEMLADHVAAARGQSALPADAAVLAGLNAVLGAAPVPASASPSASAGEADEFGFVPVGAELDLDLDATGAWQVVFAPSRAALANGGEPLLVIRELEDMGGRVIAADFAAMPGLRDLDPENGYCVWTIVLPAATDGAAIRDCFDFVAPDSRIDIARLVDAPEELALCPTCA